MKINCNVNPEYIKYIDEIILLATTRENLTFNDGYKHLNISITEEDKKITCDIITDNENFIVSEENDELKLMLKRAVFNGLSEVLGKPLSPWGILTGVRPTKVIQGFLDDGLSKEQIVGELEKNYLVTREKVNIMFEIRKQQNTLSEKLVDTLHVYIGIPFCPTRCSYCSFTSYTTEKSKSLIAPYLQGLLEEISFFGNYIRESKIKVASLYIGGGTPSSLNEQQIEQLLNTVAQNFDISNMLEYTFEGGRPDTLTAEKLEVIKRYGVTRLSINPQTMNNETLVEIGRTHTKEDFVKVFNLAREIGFDWINTDLIIGLENEGFEEYKDSLEEILNLNPENITIHSLALKRAAIQKGKSSLRYEEAKEIMDYTYESMGGNGYLPYYLYRQKSMAGNQENVGFTKPGFISPYNVISIEENSSVLALGSGAISKIIKHNGPGGIVRYANPKDPNQYLEKLKDKTQLLELLAPTITP